MLIISHRLVTTDRAFRDPSRECQLRLFLGGREEVEGGRGEARRVVRIVCAFFRLGYFRIDGNVVISMEPRDSRACVPSVVRDQ